MTIADWDSCNLLSRVVPENILRTNDRDRVYIAPNPRREYARICDSQLGACLSGIQVHCVYPNYDFCVSTPGNPAESLRFAQVGHLVDIFRSSIVRKKLLQAVVTAQLETSMPYGFYIPVFRSYHKETGEQLVLWFDEDLVSENPDISSDKTRAKVVSLDDQIKSISILVTIIKGSQAYQRMSLLNDLGPVY